MKYKMMMLIVLVCFFLSLKIYAFQGGGPPSPGDIPPPVGLPATINDKILFLIASGILLGLFIIGKKKA
jgi:hypothetical protein